MKPTRRTQPYRRGPRAPTGPLQAMLRGRPASGAPHPRDAMRLGQRRARKARRRGLTTALRPKLRPRA